MTELLIIVSHWTTPLKRDMLALTVSRPALTSTRDALTVTAALAFTVMPDHVHWLFQLGDRLTLGRTIARFKFQTSSGLLAHRLIWQRDFFEHRLRGSESVEEYALYIFLNPYRAQLINAGSWPGWWSATVDLFEFWTKLNGDGSPPTEWLELPPPEGLIDL